MLRPPGYGRTEIEKINNLNLTLGLLALWVADIIRFKLKGQDVNSNRQKES